MIKTHSQIAQEWITSIKKRRPFPQNRLIWASVLLAYQQGQTQKAKNEIERSLIKEIPNIHLALEDLDYVASLIVHMSPPKRANLLKQSALLRSPMVIQKWNWLNRH